MRTLLRRSKSGRSFPADVQPTVFGHGEVLDFHHSIPPARCTCPRRGHLSIGWALVLWLIIANNRTIMRSTDAMRTHFPRGERVCAVPGGLCVGNGPFRHDCLPRAPKYGIVTPLSLRQSQPKTIAWANRRNYPRQFSQLPIYANERATVYRARWGFKLSRSSREL